MTLNKINKNMIDPEFVQKVDTTSNQIGILSDDVGTVKTQLADTAKKSEVNLLASDKADRAQLAITDSKVSATNLRVDNLVIPISPENANVEVTDAHVSTVKNKTFTTVRNRFEEIENVQNFPTTNKITNSQFDNGLTGWVQTAIESNVVDGVANFRGGRLYKGFAALDNHIYYYFARIKSNFPVELSLYGAGKINSKGSGSFENVSSIRNWTAGTSNYIYITDIRTNTTEMIQVDHVMVIDLTATFGSGNEPTLEKMDELTASFPNGFEGTTQLISFKNMSISTMNQLKKIPSVENLALANREVRIITHISEKKFPNFNTTTKKLTFYDGTSFLLPTGEYYDIPLTDVDCNLGTTSVKIYYDTTNKKLVTKSYNLGGQTDYIFIATVRTTTGVMSIPCNYTINGKSPYEVEVETLSSAETTNTNLALNKAIVALKKAGYYGTPLLLVADLHQNFQNKSTLSLMFDLINKSIPISKVLNLGDTTTDYYVESELENFNRFSKSTSQKLLNCVGNHDIKSVADNNADGRDMYYYLVSRFEGNLFFNTGKENDLYFYHDDVTKKIRYVFLNPYTNLIHSAPSFNHEQINWLLNSALSTPDGYDILICTHEPLMAVPNSMRGAGSYTNPPSNSTVILNMLDALNKKTSVQLTDAQSNIYNVDFRNRKNNVIGVFSGHVHDDNMIKYNTVNVVTFSEYHWQENNTELLVINKLTRTVNMFRIGPYGTDRSFTY